MDFIYRLYCCTIIISYILLQLSTHTHKWFFFSLPVKSDESSNAEYQARRIIKNDMWLRSSN